MHGAKRHAFVNGVREHAPPRKLKKIGQFGAFWSIFCCNVVKKFFAKMFILYTIVIDIVLLGTIFRGIGTFSPELLFFVLKTGAPVWGGGGQSSPLGFPPGKKRFFSFWQGGGFLHVGTFLLIFATLTFSMCLPHLPPPLQKFLPPPPPCSSVVGNFLLWNAIMTLWSHNYPIVIELGEGGA